MKALCFEKNDRLNLTEYTQAALVTTCLAMEKVVEECGLYPDITAGLSLGEYCAIAVSGGMSVKDAIVTVRKRGILMEHAVPAGEGSMAAVIGLDADKIQITGPKPAVEEASVKLKEAGARRVLSLAVSGPFHSSLLQNAGKELEKELSKVEFSGLKIPYVTNVTAQCVTDISETKDLLARQISSSVLWQQSVEKMIQEGVDTFVEIGPGKTLAGFMKKIAPEMKTYNIQNVEDLEQISDLIHSRK